MGAKFSRIKVWVKEKLYFQDLNAEFDNILNNLGPSGIDGASATLPAMQATTDPAPYVSGTQTPSLATDLEGEIERLRFVDQRFFGTANWYTDPGRILSALPTDLLSLLNFEGPTITEASNDSIGRDLVLAPVTLSAPDVTSGALASTNKKFTGYSFNLGAAVILAQRSQSSVIGGLSLHFRNLSPGDYLAYNPALGISVFLDASGFLTYKQTLTTAASETAKNALTISGAVSRAGNTSYQHVLARWVLNAASGSGLDSLGLQLDNLAEGSQLNAQTAPVNGNFDNFWLFGAKVNPITWDKASAFAVLPDAEAVNPWTASGAAGNSVTAGLLTVASAGSVADLYSNSTLINAAQMTIETKAKLSVYANEADALVLTEVLDTAAGRLITVQLVPGALQILDNGSVIQTVYVDTENPSVYRVTLNGSPNPVVKVFINGVLTCRVVSTAVHIGGTTSVKFGVRPAGGSNATGVFEYYNYFTTGAAVSPVTGDATGQLAEIATARTAISNSIAIQLKNNPARIVYGTDVRPGVFCPKSLGVVGSQLSLGAITGTDFYFNSDGKTPVQFVFSGVVTTPSTVVVGLQLDDLVVLEAASVSTPNEEVNFSGKRVFKSGLRKLKLAVIVDGSGTATVVASGELRVERSS